MRKLLIMERSQFCSLAFLFAFISKGYNDVCSLNGSLWDYPGNFKDFVITAMYGTAFAIVGCPDEYRISPNKVGLWLYNRKHYKTPVRLTLHNLSELNTKEPIIFIIHGYFCQMTSDGIPEMKDAYLKRYHNPNIILVDWAYYSLDYYPNAFCNAPKVAAFIARFICSISVMLGIDLRFIHLIGHSQGAHIAGLTGQETQAQCRMKIGRITGLDPAALLYQVLSENRRLDASDAYVVDVIHTNQALLGYHGSCGTVDFYPNCGYTQPGCSNVPIPTDGRELLAIPFKIYACSHHRSMQYFTESILGGNFKATSCTLCPGPQMLRICVRNFIFKSTATMGQDYIYDPGTSAKYYLETNSKAPFAKG